MSKKNKLCQSCSMPLKKDPQGGGTNSDGSKSGKYCSYCWKDGEFTDKEITDVKEYQKFVVDIMKKDGMNGVLAWVLTRGIPRMER